jgi:hypothetical protein
MKPSLFLAAVLNLVAVSVSSAQAQESRQVSERQESRDVSPVPIPGGDVFSPGGLFSVFSPGVGVGLDGQDAEPHVITNFKGHIAMGYTLGSATDNAGKHYAVITDIRVYQGDYIGGVATYVGGGTTSAKSHGTFVEI